MPRRVQLSRRKGWRMPDNTVKVDRTTKWGNPMRVAGPRTTAKQVVDAFRRALAENNATCILDFDPRDIRQLRGKNLACWCPLDQPCHADVLLELANK